MGDDDPGDLTGVLKAVRRGEPDAEIELFDRVYRELHKMAHGRLLRERRDPTMLQTTALVNEAYMRLVRDEPANWENRSHFFGAAVQAMRRILVDYARRRDAERRGGGTPPITLQDDVEAGGPAYDILALNDCLDRLTKIRRRAATVVGYRFFLGLTVKEIAGLLDVSPRTVDSDWQFAGAWLRREIGQASGNDGG